MIDILGQAISGYRYGGYWFGVTQLKNGRFRTEKISGLSGSSFDTEHELLMAYDSTNGAGREDGPGLIRVYLDGSQAVLRKGDNSNAA